MLFLNKEKKHKMDKKTLTSAAKEWLFVLSVCLCGFTETRLIFSSHKHVVASIGVSNSISARAGRCVKFQYGKNLF